MNAHERYVRDETIKYSHIDLAFHVKSEKRYLLEYTTMFTVLYAVVSAIAYFVSGYEVALFLAGAWASLVGYNGYRTYRRVRAFRALFAKWGRS